MKNVLVVAFGVGTLLDFFLSILGMGIILQAESVLVYLISIAVAFALVCLRLCMEIIFEHSGILYYCLRAAFFVSIVIAFFASANALACHVLFKKPFGPRSL
jgi:hypothetical protein